jgi:hypothetical protein
MKIDIFIVFTAYEAQFRTLWGALQQSRVDIRRPQRIRLDQLPLTLPAENVSLAE